MRPRATTAAIAKHMLTAIQACLRNQVCLDVGSAPIGSPASKHPHAIDDLDNVVRVRRELSSSQRQVTEEQWGGGTGWASLADRILSVCRPSQEYRPIVTAWHATREVWQSREPSTWDALFATRKLPSMSHQTTMADSPPVKVAAAQIRIRRAEQFLCQAET